MNNNNEPAFPFEGGDNNRPQPTYGMTLRDYFAAKVAQGFATDEGLVWTERTARDVARGAYMFADAMLEERLK